RSTAFPPTIDSYVVSVEGGPERKLPLFEAKEAYLAPTASKTAEQAQLSNGLVAFVRGPGTWYRRGYRGSSNDEIWIGNTDGTSQKRLTTLDGKDGSPMWSSDARTLFYVSENGSRPGCANIVYQEIDSSSAPRRVTDHEEDTVRRARISGNGEWIVYECG